MILVSPFLYDVVANKLHELVRILLVFLCLFEFRMDIKDRQNCVFQSGLVAIAVAIINSIK